MSKPKPEWEIWIEETETKCIARGFGEVEAWHVVAKLLIQMPRGCRAWAEPVNGWDQLLGEPK